MGENEEIPNQYTYEVEKDYLEWEGLLVRQSKLLEIRKKILKAKELDSLKEMVALGGDALKDTERYYE